MPDHDRNPNDRKVRLLRPIRRRPGVLLLLAAGLAGCATAQPRPRTAVEEATIVAPMHALPTTPEEFLAQARGTYVVVDLDHNRLRLMQDKLVLWEAPVGTGTGLRLRGEDDDWHFSTPRGVFQIQFKEELPVWVLPDWYYVEKKLPIPPQNAPERRMAGQLGVAAVYLGDEIAIHGTERPELLGKRVSHGCIRLANRNAMRLFHNVEVGTPVVILGGEQFDTLPPPPSTDPGKPRPKATDPLAGVSTAELLTRLDTEIARSDTSSNWVPIASRLITRGLKDDAPALRGMLERAGKPATERRKREFGTFLADLFTRGSLRTVVSLARIDEASRKQAAQDIVESILSLYPLSLDVQGAPWPSHRVPPSRLGPDGRSGWQALADAEAEFRETRMARATR
jgi:hypothetical protein